MYFVLVNKLHLEMKQWFKGQIKTKHRQNHHPATSCIYSKAPKSISKSLTTVKILSAPNSLLPYSQQNAGCWALKSSHWFRDL